MNNFALNTCMVGYVWVYNNVVPGRATFEYKEMWVVGGGWEVVVVGCPKSALVYCLWQIMATVGPIPEHEIMGCWYLENVDI